MCKPQKVLSQQTNIKDNFKNLTFWGFTLTSILQEIISLGWMETLANFYYYKTFY